MKAIFLIAGHGLKNGREDNGAAFNGTTEYKEVCEIVTEAEAYLVSSPDFAKYKKVENMGEKGVETTVKTPDKIQVICIGNQKRMDLIEKINLINEICKVHNWDKKEVLLVSCHINAATKSASGSETWYENDSKDSKNLAKIMQEKLIEETGFRSRGLKDDKSNRHGRLGIIRDTIPTACLVECGFITNDIDARMLRDPVEDDKIALGIAKGIAEAAGVGELKTKNPNWYKDIPEGVWYEKSVKELLAKGVLVVPNSGLFRPSDTVNRAEMATMIARAFGLLP